MHKEVYKWIEGVRASIPEYFTGADVLEVGSLDINGSVRPLFQGCAYTGCDVGPGKGVDIVESGDKLSFPDQRFDTVISVECFEHNSKWVETFMNMYRMLKIGGLMIVTCACPGRPEHGTLVHNPGDAPFTNNYYKNLSPNDFCMNFGLGNMFSEYDFFVNPVVHDMYFYGIKAFKPD